MKIKDLKKKISEVRCGVAKVIRESCNCDPDTRDWGYSNALRDVLLFINGITPDLKIWKSEWEVVYKISTEPETITGAASDFRDLYSSVNVARGVDYKTKPVGDWTALNFTMYVKDRIRGSVVFDTGKLKSVKLPNDIIKMYGKVKYKEFVDYLLEEELVENFEIFSSKKAWQIFMKRLDREVADVPLATTLDKKSKKALYTDEGGF